MDTGYTPTLQNDSLTNSTKVYLLSILGIHSTYQKRSILRNGEGKKKKKKKKNTIHPYIRRGSGCFSWNVECFWFVFDSSRSFFILFKDKFISIFFFSFFFWFSVSKEKKKMREKALEAKSGIFLCLCH